jgi:hypothetical protein
VWFSAEYLLWWIKDSPLPVPLLSTGAIGAPGTSTLLGNQQIDNEGFQGGRFSAGYWFDDQHAWGIEGIYFFLGQRSVSEQFNSNPFGGSVVGFPFFDVSGTATATGLPGEAFMALGVPGASVTHASVSLSSFLQGAEVNGLYNLWCCNCLRVDLLAGLRFLQLQEKLGFATEMTTLGVGPGLTSMSTQDQFNTRNDFYGGQVGAKAEYVVGPWFVNGTAKVALGDIHEILDVSGQNTISMAGGSPVTTTGGLFAQRTNIGHLSHNRFAVIPEVDFNVGYQFTDWFRAFVGYSFLAVSDVARPGDQIDRNVNPTQLFGGTLAGPARPLPLLRESSFWAQGINFGVELRY